MAGRASISRASPHRLNSGPARRSTCGETRPSITPSSRSKPCLGRLRPMMTPPDLTPDLALEAVTAAAATEAPARDADGAFPTAAFEALRALGVTANPPLGGRQMTRLLALLAAAGRGDLSVGRIFEGHCNTLFLIQAHGTAEQRNNWFEAAASGALYGIWNTDQPGAPLRLENGVLLGGKSFSTGIDGLDRAIVTIDDGPKRQMITVPLAGLAVDRSWWRPVGMRASGSHIVDFTGLKVDPEWLLGGPGDYVGQPWFTAGAMRFAAVQVGGMHAILDLTLDHLSKT
ncbi:MAG: acyl-CoA dehydrogenase, partial [Brevundimonas sp.]